MKFIAVFLLTLSSFLSSTAFPMALKENPSQRIFSALKGGDAKALALNFSRSLKLSVNKQEEVYSRFQAELILAEFFKNNSVVEVKEIQKRANEQANPYIVYLLKTSKQSYRIFVKFAPAEDNFKISTFRIELQRT